MIVVFLSALVGMILVRSVYGDISRYNIRVDEMKPMSDEQKVRLLPHKSKYRHFAVFLYL